MSFPRRRESTLTISWIPSFEGMTREGGLSFPGFFVIPTKVGIQNKYLYWIPSFEGMTRERVIPKLRRESRINISTGSPLSRG
ncbi:MAG: hypothetical protein SFT68_04295 [Rickettsiaceae bacterium]|nr:hypothetical protein [Rickettsiaceae bacterium]